MKSEAAALEETEHSIYVPENDADDDENELEAGPDALKALNSFLVASGKEPSPCHLQVPWESATLLRILSNSCPASERKSLQGLDYYVTDGGKAFDNLLSVIEELELYGLSKEESSEIKQALREGKTYLKSEYKVIMILLKLPRVRKE